MVESSLPQPREIAIAFMRTSMTGRLELARKLDLLDGIDQRGRTDVVSLEILKAVKAADKVDELATLLGFEMTR